MIDGRAQKGESDMDTNVLRNEISEFLGFKVPEFPAPFETHGVVEEQGYSRNFISYQGREGDNIPAFLLIPKGSGPFPAVLVHHQHNGERHLGKSEVCGLVGDPLQAFGPVLAKKGFVVLAPDSICFEDRRRNRSGTEPGEEMADWLQHYNEMCYRLVRGDTLMTKVLDDAALGIALLCGYPVVDRQRIGTWGHSYGGNTVLFHAALDERIRFACSSGAACTYENKMANETGIEMAEAVPGFAQRFDIQDLVRCIAPRRILLVSAAQDKYSKDADVIADMARDAFAALGVEERLEHKRYAGGHPLTQERFDYIVEWIRSLT